MQMCFEIHSNVAKMVVSLTYSDYVDYSDYVLDSRNSNKHGQLAKNPQNFG